MAQVKALAAKPDNLENTFIVFKCCAPKQGFGKCLIREKQK